MRPIVFNKGGYITLKPYEADGSIGDIILSAAKVQSIQAQTTQQTAQLAEGNSDWQSDYDTFKEGNIVVTMKNYDPRLHAALLGTETETGSREMFRTQETTIMKSDEGDYDFELDKEPQDVTIYGTDGELFKLGDETAGTGEYTLDGNTVTFAAVDDGRGVVIKYSYTEAEAVSASFPDKGVRPALQAIVDGEILDDTTSRAGWCNIFIDTCKAVGEISPPTMQREPQTWQFTLKVNPPRPGYKPVDYVFEPAK